MILLRIKEIKKEIGGFVFDKNISNLSNIYKFD